MVSGCSLPEFKTDDKKYDVIYIKESGVSGQFATTLEFKKGDTFTLPENSFTKKGYEFKNWIINEEAYLPGSKYTVKEEHILVSIN